MWLMGGRVFEDGAGTFRVADLRVEGNRIAEIGRAPAGAEGIDLAGAWLLPGFFD